MTVGVNMGKVLSRAAAMIALGISLPAGAADFSVPPYKAPAPYPGWSGFYLGAYAGASGATGADFGLGGGLAGGTAGFNWQNGALVAGIEGEGGWAGLSGQTNCTAAVVTCTTRDRWFASARGRLGWTVIPNLLLYGTAGAAFGDLRETVDFFGSASTNRVGWAAGAGVEWMVMPNWSIKAEYLHYDFGTFVCGAGVCIPGQAVPVPFAFDTGKVGVNYHFSSGPATPWW
jgi:outer membrane immunogenic protein